ncbi:MAG: ribose-5-phosphate isomerase RpiA [Capsulimonadales bacterium]|nr:ribose-5-phosphate isomerase RpiA [Capsulimonadales bacterium]
MNSDVAKRAAARAAAALVQDGMLLGIGSGSTANHFQAALAERIREQGLHLRGVAPSRRSEENALSLGIPLIAPTRETVLDLAVDGADEITLTLQAIKGGGGALVREKIVVAAAKRFIVIADDSKLVPYLGAFPLPVAVLPFGWERTARRIEDTFGVPVSVRGGSETPFVSDDGLRILDLRFGRIADPEETYRQLRTTVGVVDCGLFLDLAGEAILGAEDGSIRVLSRSEAA